MLAQGQLVNQISFVDIGCHQKYQKIINYRTDVMIFCTDENNDQCTFMWSYDWSAWRRSATKMSSYRFSQRLHEECLRIWPQEGPKTRIFELVVPNTSSGLQSSFELVLTKLFSDSKIRKWTALISLNLARSNPCMARARQKGDWRHAATIEDK